MRRDAARHPDHHARVAVPAAHVAGARDARARSRRSSSTRSTRWSPPSAARTCSSRSSGSRRCGRRAARAAPAHRPLGDAAAARRGRALARRRRDRRRGEALHAAPGRRSSTPARRRRSSSASRCRSRTWRSSASVERARSSRRAGRARARARSGRRIHPRLVELVRAHRSTMIFVNSRRLAERLAAALNELAGEEIALAHHGSVAREQRARDRGARSRRASCPRIVATSSLELGIDMGAVDLVIQIEAPPSVASGIQRIGRAGHHVGGVSRGVHLPQVPRRPARLRRRRRAHARAARSRRRCYPRNPLDVLAQQIVAIVAMDDDRTSTTLFALVRRAAPFAELPARERSRACSTCSRPLPVRRVRRAAAAHHLGPRRAARSRAREGAKRLADRQRAAPSPTAASTACSSTPASDARREREPARRRARRGDGLRVARGRGLPARRLVVAHRARSPTTACSSRPRPGEPGQDAVLARRPRRPPVEFGARDRRARARRSPRRRADEAERDARRTSTASTRARPTNLVALPRASRPRRPATCPSDRTIVVERFLDELGDWRVCMLSPFGAACTRLGDWRRSRGCRDASAAVEVEAVWTDDGIVFRLPERETPPDVELLFPRPTRSRTSSSREPRRAPSLFAARFRESAGARAAPAAPSPGKRTPLWAQRKRAADLLAVASRYGSFPILLETYRECLRDVFDLPGARRAPARRSQRARSASSRSTRATPSPFAASLLFAYVGNFIYDGDAPLAERRAQALTIDHAAAARAARRGRAARAARPRRDRRRSSAPLQRLDGARAAQARRRAPRPAALARRPHARRDRARAALRRRAERRERAALDRRARPRAARHRGRRSPASAASSPPRTPRGYRDALGVVAAARPARRRSSSPSPIRSATSSSRYARTHGPFRADDVARALRPRRRAGARRARAARRARPRGRGRVPARRPRPRVVRRRGAALAEAPLARAAARARSSRSTPDGARALPRSSGTALHAPRARGLDALLAVDRAAPGRAAPGLRPGDRDPAGARRGLPARRSRRALRRRRGGLARRRAARRRATAASRSTSPIGLPLLAPPPGRAEGDARRGASATRSRARGALFFSDLVARDAAPSRPTLLAALWDLVWAGEVTNDTLAPLRALAARRSSGRRRDRERAALRGLAALRARRIGPPGSEGRWSLVRASARAEPGRRETERRAALARALLERHGVLTREAVQRRGARGRLLRGLRRAQGDGGGRPACGAATSSPGSARRSSRCPAPTIGCAPAASRPTSRRTLVLAATDPANPYGAAVPWPELPARRRRPEGAVAARRPQRAAGAQVILHDGRLLALARPHRAEPRSRSCPRPSRSAATRSAPSPGRSRRSSTRGGGARCSWPRSTASPRTAPPRARAGGGGLHLRSARLPQARHHARAGAGGGRGTAARERARLGSPRGGGGPRCAGGRGRRLQAAARAPLVASGPPTGGWRMTPPAGATEGGAHGGGRRRAGRERPRRRRPGDVRGRRGESTTARSSHRQGLEWPSPNQMIPGPGVWVPVITHRRPRGGRGGGSAAASRVSTAPRRTAEQP